MFQLIESILLLDGQFVNLPAHQERVDNALNDLYKTDKRIDLKEFLHTFNFPATGRYKCRMMYNPLSKDVEFLPYTFKAVNTLKIRVDNSIVYDYKYADRSSLNKLMADRGECDDILIVKNGWVTDSSYANIIFKRKDKWYTPHSCLLRGTMRQILLRSGTIQEEQIAMSDIQKFEKFRLINAMLGFDSPECDISNIYS